MVTAFDASARYRGDLNGDDRVDLADMVHLAKAIKAGSTDKSFDVNASGIVDDYDLQRLADIIISGKLTEDSGMNVGIGGWEDSGEDYGGSVKAPAFTTRSADETRFYMNNPKSEDDGRYSMEFGISEGNEPTCAILFNIRLPREMSFDTSKTIELDPAIASTHKLYGTPKFIKENENDEWSDYSLRFIVMSPDLSALPNSTGKLGSISYSMSDCWGEPYFRNCQTAAAGSGECMDIPEHGGGYYGNFKPVEISSVWFEMNDMTLTEGDEWNLYANIDPWDATDQSLVWTSSDESVAAVSTEDGRNATVKALKEGEAVITATSSNGISATCTVRVEKRYIEVTEIVLSNTELKMTEGDTAKLTATVNPSDATDKTLTWTSSDASVASVSSNGEVKALKPGTATIIVSSSNGKTAACSVTVNAKEIEMEAIILDAEELSLEIGDTYQFTATLLPAETTHPELEWWSDDESVAKVDGFGLVTMMGEGATVVHVRSVRWPGIEATCRINVTDAVDGIIADNAPCDIYTSNGQLIKKAVPPSEIQYLERGIYIIRQGGKTTKLLK